MGQHFEQPDDAADAFEFAAIESPLTIAGNERRLHMRARAHWDALRNGRALPSITDIDPAELAHFTDQSVLLDFSGRSENPAIIYIGTRLRDLCAIKGTVERQSALPNDCLLANLTRHYPELLDASCPIEFDDEFVQPDGGHIFYRGILLPFSTTGGPIDFAYGVISWKESADDALNAQLAIEIQDAMRNTRGSGNAEPLWDEPLELGADDEADASQKDIGDLADDLGFDDLSIPSDATDDETVGEVIEDTDKAPAAEIPWNRPEDYSAGAEGMHAALDRARNSATEAMDCAARSREALYEAIGCAYDFAVAARQAPDALAAMLEINGIEAQDRAPMTAIAKLVFGADYDKTRLAEYALALEYGLAHKVPEGALAARIIDYPGGLKGLVTDVRAERRPAGAPKSARLDRARARLAKAKPIAVDALTTDADSLCVAVLRRTADGAVEILSTLTTDQKLAQQVMVLSTRRRKKA